jgi:hypothetical protein
VGAVLIGLAPLPWLGLGLANAAPGDPAPGNNGTLKIHELGTPSGFEDNDPKVCIFNIEGFSFDPGQTGYLVLATQGGDGPTNPDVGPVAFGPTDDSGYYATLYFNGDSGITVPDGHYKATLYGKQLPTGDLTDVKAKSKVFKVSCETTSPSPSTTETSKSPSPTESQTTESVSPTETETVSPTETETVSPTETETVSPSESQTTESVSPTESQTSESVSPTQIESSQPGNTHSSTPGTTVLPTDFTSSQPAELPHTGPTVPVAPALALSALLVALGGLLLFGPGRLTAIYNRQH